MNADPGILLFFNSLPDIYFNKTSMLRLSLWGTGNQTRNAPQILYRALTSELYKPFIQGINLWMGGHQETTDKAEITCTSSKSQPKIPFINPCIDIVYTNTQECILISRLEKACKDFKTATTAKQFMKYLGPCTLIQIAKYRMTSL